MFRKFTASVLLVLSVMSSAQAQTFPSQKVTVVVPYGAGGPFDLVARFIARELEKTWKQPVVVENKVGGNEVIAGEFVAKSPPDGHTFLLSTNAATVYAPVLYPKLSYDPERDLAPVGRLINSHFLIVTSGVLPFKTLQELFAAAKKEPGKYSYVSVGLSVNALLFFKANQVPLLKVPYKAVAPAVQDLIPGRVDVAFLSPTAVEPHVKAGRLRALATTGPKRHPGLPDVPTVREAGAIDQDASFDLQLHVQGKTPPAHINTIWAAVREIISSDEFRKQVLLTQGFELVAEGPADYRAYLQKNRSVIQEKLRASGLTAE